jgi:hypothetical protein
VCIDGCHDIVFFSSDKTPSSGCPFVAGDSTLRFMLVVQRVIYQGSS